MSIKLFLFFAIVTEVQQFIISKNLKMKEKKKLKIFHPMFSECPDNWIKIKTKNGVECKRELLVK